MKTSLNRTIRRILFTAIVVLFGVNCMAIMKYAILKDWVWTIIFTGFALYWLWMIMTTFEKMLPAYEETLPDELK